MCIKNSHAGYIKLRAAHQGYWEYVLDYPYRCENVDPYTTIHDYGYQYVFGEYFGLYQLAYDCKFDGLMRVVLGQLKTYHSDSKDCYDFEEAARHLSDVYEYIQEINQGLRRFVQQIVTQYCQDTGVHRKAIQGLLVRLIEQGGKLAVDVYEGIRKACRKRVSLVPFLRVIQNRKIRKWNTRKNQRYVIDMQMAV
ncbi:hypothetical protein AJ80_08542 [Polytolypa hystricis UAMH7299]|uniref:Uncharacterized protein n=1 Tax=Polytolypa hystricis (strain UAMH7299) TaxID=1447883 RepID=A0A2B7X605_POLH7|nr:hypothetical protein AJ80_08542 [Polytolypa hystricis UAMH7299]